MNDSARTAWVITAAAVVVLVVLSLWAGAAPTSDAYVAFQYARNVADGHGLVANPGERPSEGYDNLLWVLAAAALRRIGLDPPAAAPFLSLLLGVACVVTLSSLLRRRAGRPAEWIVPLFALAASGPFVIASMSLSGLTSFAFLLLLAAWSLDRIGSGGGAVHGVILVLAVALAVVARFEGIVVAAAAAVVVLAMTRSGAVTRRFGFTTAGAVVTAVLCYHVWRFSVFGRFLPDSVILDAGLNRAFFVPTQPFDVAPFGAYYVAVALITVAAFVRSPRRGAACNRFAVAVAGILGLYYLFVADAVPGLGHHSALLGLALLTWPVAVRELWPETAAAAQWSRPLVGRVALVGAASLMLVGVVSELRLNVKQMEQSCSEAQIALGRWLRDWRPGITIATDDPGPLTYYARAITLDLRSGSRIGGSDADRAAALARFRPDLILFAANGMFEPNPVILETARFNPVLGGYRVLGAVRTGWTLDRVLLMYLRKDIPALTEAQLDSFPTGVGPALRLNR